MPWKRYVSDGAVWCAARFAPSMAEPPRSPKSIFVLRNNDLGDLLVVTPLFDALRRAFPETPVVVGVGDWCRPILDYNPHITTVLSINAPWHNKHIVDQGVPAALRYIWNSSEVDALKAARCEVGLDVLGSSFGSLLMMRAGIPFRAGVAGYADGGTGLQRRVAYDPEEHVGRVALRFAELLGATDLPVNRPQLFLTPEEIRAGEAAWNERRGRGNARRILIGPGAGFAAKSWPADRFAALVSRLAARPDNQIIVCGAALDAEVCGRVAGQHPDVTLLVGGAGLRFSFALAACADLVVCNASMFMHASAAVGTPAVVLLGPWFGPGDQHLAQWGHPGFTHQLGGGGQIASPEDAEALVERVLRSTAPSQAAR